MLMAWAQLYAELLHCGGEGVTSAWLDEESMDALLFLATAAACFLLLDGMVVLCHGTLTRGRILVGQEVCWVGTLVTAAMLAVMLLNISERRPCLLCVVPVFALVRLLLIPLTDEPGLASAQAAALLRKRSLDLPGVLRALDSDALLGESERRTLREVAREADGLAVADGRGSDNRAWDEATLKSFLRDAELALTGPRHRLSCSKAEASLLGLVEQLRSGGSPASAASRVNYGIFTSLLSGLRQLAHGGMQELAVFCAAAVLDGCLGPVQAWLISLLTKAAMEGDRDAARWQIAAFMGSYALGTAAYSALVSSYSVLLAKGTATMQRRIAAKMLAMGSKEHAAYPNGSVNAMFASDVTRLQDLWTGATWSFLAPLMKVLIAVLYAIHVSPQVGVLALTVFPLIFVTVPQCHSSSVAAAHTVANSETISMFQNGVACQPMIWSCDKQSDWLRRYLEPKISDQRRKHLKMRLWGGIVQAYVQQLVSLFVAVHVAILAWLAATGGISVAEFTGFVSLFSSLGTPSISLGGFYRVAVACAGSAQRVDEFLQEGPSVAGSTTLTGAAAAECDLEAPPVPAARRDDAALEEAPGDLVVDSLSYCYPGSAKPTIEDVSFTVQPGDFASIVGGSGCGKSTLLSLLMTWLQPASGCVSIGPGLTLGPGGQDRRDNAAATAVARRLRDRVAVVFQETMLLSATVHENIAISAPGEVTRADVEWAAAAAGCADFITSHLPDGYDTMLGAEGTSLSGGQAQRICIARALCRKPSVLLLDEATSALDPTTAGQILKTIASLNVNYPSVFGSLIVVSITHHPDSLSYSNLIVCMDAGHVDKVEKRLCCLEPVYNGGSSPIFLSRQSTTEAMHLRQEPDPEAMPCNGLVSAEMPFREKSTPGGRLCMAVKTLEMGGSDPDHDLHRSVSASDLRVGGSTCAQAPQPHTCTLLGG